MRVRIDATSLLLRSAGIKSYNYHWIEHLRANAGSDEILPFPYLDRIGGLDHEVSVLPAWQTYPRLALLYFLNIPGNTAIDRVAAGADVFHLSNQVRNIPRNIRLTATVYDLTCRIHPEVHTAANVEAEASYQGRVFPEAHGLIAISQNSKNDAVRLLGIHPDKLTVIYPGIAPEYFDAEPAPAAKPYVLFVSTLEPRKNVDRLLDAWHLLRADLRDQFDLVVAGATGWSSERTATRLRAGISGVKYLGYVPERDLPGLTAGASVFIYPSLYEGFGLPVAQAMASSVPIVTSNTSCLPEVVGEGGLYADPCSVLEISNALDRLLTSPDLRRRIGTAGRHQADRYTWDACARQSVAFFRQIAGA